MTIGVIIPALNASQHLPALLEEISAQHPNWPLLVVDDGSTDDTGPVATSRGARVIRHAENRGKGAALSTGFQWAQAEKLEWVYTMDADGQHLPAEMDQFLQAARSGPWDIVVGTRMADTALMPWLRQVTNRFTSGVISRLAGCKIPDSQSGFRLFRMDLPDPARRPAILLRVRKKLRRRHHHRHPDHQDPVLPPHLQKPHLDGKDEEAF